MRLGQVMYVLRGRAPNEFHPVRQVEYGLEPSLLTSPRTCQSPHYTHPDQDCQSPHRTEGGNGASSSRPWMPFPRLGWRLIWRQR